MTPTTSGWSSWSGSGSRCSPCRPPESSARSSSAVILVGIGATIARTGSRGAFVGLLAVGLALLFLLKSVSVVKRVAFIVVTALGLMLWAPEGYWEQMETIKTPTQDYNWSARDGRKQVAKRGMGYMLKHPHHRDRHQQLLACGVLRLGQGADPHRGHRHQVQRGAQLVPAGGRGAGHPGPRALARSDHRGRSAEC